MKKLACLLLIFCNTIAVRAQKISSNELQGTWTVAAMNAEGIYVDIATGIITIPEDIKSQLTPEMLDQMTGNMKEGIKNIKDSKVIFSGNNYSQNRNGNEKKGTYVIKDIDGKQQIVLTNSEGVEKAPAIIYIKDKQLHLAKSEQVEIIFNRL